MKHSFRFLIVLFIGLFATSARGYAQSQVSLSGRVLHAKNLISLEDMSEFSRLKPPSSNISVPLDSNGNFNVSFPLDKPCYFRLGRNILYLTPGDQLTANVDVANSELATFSGKDAVVNAYMRYTPFPKAGSFLASAATIQPHPEQTLDRILSIAKAKRKQLDSLTDIAPEFRRLEEARIKADVIVSIMSLRTYIRYSRTPSQEYVHLFNAMAKPVLEDYCRDFVDASLLQLEAYRDISSEILKQAPAGHEADRQKIRDWIQVQDTIVKMNQVHSKDELARFKGVFAGIKTAKYAQAGEVYLQSLLRFGKGDPAIDFTATDIHGGQVSLSSLKGKAIYVDLWATWCGPCMKQMPWLDSLKEKYKDNPKVAFVSLSIDDEASLDKWKKSVAERKADGYQWEINAAKLAAYTITGIPRMILINPDFTIADLNGPLPADPAAIASIDGMLTGKEPALAVRQRPELPAADPIEKRDVALYFQMQETPVFDPAERLYRRQFAATQKGTVSLDPITQAEYAAGYAILRDRADSLTAAFVKAHVSSPAAAGIIYDDYRLKSNLDRTEGLYNALSSEAQQNATAKELKDKIDLGRRVVVGTKAPDFSMKDTSGNMVSLSSFRGKYVLIDFWASWCGPCRKENPNVVKAYKQYKDHNFTVLGVSLDRPGAKAAWEKAIRDDGLFWTQVSDLQYFNTAAVKLYGIIGIPQNFLISPDGTLIATNLRGDALFSKLASLLN
jgi:thiol-disulfide isomerase/thioredoxin